MTGQASAAPMSFDAIAGMLANNPEMDSPQERARDGSVADTEHSNSDALALRENTGPGPDTTKDDIPDDEPLRLRGGQDGESRVPAKRTGQTFEVTVTGEDGKETKLTVDHAERGNGYLRFNDYTKKTQALVKREEAATKLVETKLSEGMQQAAQATSFAMAAIQRLANFQSPEQMLALAQANPHAHQVEQARAAAIHSVLNELAGQLQVIKQKGEEQAKDAREHAIARLWESIEAEGIDKKALHAIFDVVVEKYGHLSSNLAEKLNNRLDDPALVMLMRDAVELHKLRAAAEDVRKKSSTAPTMSQRQRSSRAGEQDTTFVRRARAGRAGLGDLAGFLERNGHVTN